MNIFKTSSKEKFIDEIIEFITANYDDFSKLKILLPNGLTCRTLQHALIKKHGTIILPKITPISELVAEDEEIFKIPSQQIGVITRLEEKLTLAKVIHSYPDLNYDLSQSLRLSSSLAQLFFEFEANNLEFKNLQDLPKLDESEHWNMIYNFLSFAQEKWLDNIQDIKKITRSAYQTQIFKSELGRLSNKPDQSLIIAGIVGQNEITNEFISKAIKLSNAEIILPPFKEEILKNKLLPKDPLYKTQKFLEKLENNFNLKTLGVTSDSIVDKLISNSTSAHYNNNIEYIELENKFHEAEYIAITCQESIANNPAIKIAIITHDQNSKEECATFLDKYELSYNDLFGEDILKHSNISLILLISELLYSKFNLKTLFAFFSHPLIATEQTKQLKNLIRKRNRLASSLDAITKTIEKYGTEELLNELSSLIDLIKMHHHGQDFHNMFQHALQVTEKIIPTIWIDHPDTNAPLSEIIHKKWDIKIDDIGTFPELLKQILEGGRINGSKFSNNITLCRAHDTALINYDLIIISDINENKYPKSMIGSPWLNLHMQKELDLDSKIAETGIALYEFYLNIHNKKTILTRAKKSDGTQTLPSPFILHLQYILGNKLEAKIAIAKFADSPELKQETAAISHSFPKQISATDIETLIRSPYNFYAKKILKLRKIDEISDRPNLADFGNFFHQIAEDYTNHFPESSIKNLSNDYLKKIDIPEYSKKAWHTKIMSIAPELINFETNRREQIKSVHCEIKGTVDLNINGTKVTILAIADRIEIDQDGNAYIMDYKTGSIPTKKNVLSGLSPQLIIESIILAENGFDIPGHQVNKIIYIKINSNKPYIKITEIEISTDDIQAHKQGLIELLGHYISTNEYPIEPCLMKYDDYTHFARRL